MTVSTARCPWCGAEIPSAGIKTVRYCGHCAAALRPEDRMPIEIPAQGSPGSEGPFWSRVYELSVKLNMAPDTIVRIMIEGFMERVLADPELRDIVLKHSRRRP